MSNSSKNICAKFDEIETRNIQLSKELYKKYYNTYNKCFNLLVDVCVQIFDNLEKPLNDNNASVAFNCARIIGSLRVYVDLMAKGYYYDANIIRRTLIENFYLIRSFVKNRKNIDRWMDNKLKFRDIKKELGFKSDERFLGYYRELCNFVHSNVGAFRLYVDFSEKQKSALGFDLDSKIKIFFTPRVISDSSIEVGFFPIIGFLTINWLAKMYWDSLKPDVRTYVSEALKKWEFEFLDLLDRFDKEFEENEKGGKS